MWDIVKILMILLRVSHWVYWGSNLREYVKKFDFILQSDCNPSKLRHLTYLYCNIQHLYYDRFEGVNLVSHYLEIWLVFFFVIYFSCHCSLSHTPSFSTKLILLLDFQQEGFDVSEVFNFKTRGSPWDKLVKF